jgi:hypothetical protein
VRRTLKKEARGGKARRGKSMKNPGGKAERRRNWMSSSRKFHRKLERLWRGSLKF